MPLILPANTLSTGGFSVANSCRFNDGDSAYMYRSNGTPTSQRILTISTWLKRGTDMATTDVYQYWMGIQDTGVGDPRMYIGFNDSGQLNTGEKDGAGENVWKFTTNRVFRDPSAWMNIVLSIDTTQGTEANRVKIYVNGTQETSFATSTYPTENLDMDTTGNEINVACIDNSSPSGFFDGYIAEMVYSDGQAYAASDFGEFDEDSPTIWKPKDVSGLTFGDNGFYLDFEDSANLGNDANGGTDFTTSGLAATDQATDTPTNNFCTLNPLYRSYDNDTVFSEGNLKASWASNSDRGYGMSTIGVTSGKWYCEVKAIDKGRLYLGVGDGNFLAGQTVPVWQPDPSNGIAININSGNMEYNGDTLNDTYGTGASDDDIIQIALDMDNYLLWFGINNTWMNSATETEIENSTATNDVTTAIGTQNIINNGEPINIFALDGSTSGTTDAEFNFGNPPYANTSDAADENGYGAFEFAPPSGYYAVCTKNLAEFGG